MTQGERRYFQVLGALSVLSLATIGGTAAMERFVGPAWEVFPSLASRPAQAQVREDLDEPADEPAPASELRLDGPWLLPGEPLTPCIAALDPLDLEPADDSSRWVPPLTLDESELCLLFD